MSAERWQEVKKVLASALERRPEERGAYLDQACTDLDLRREVESLLAAHEQEGSSFMEQSLNTSPPLEKGAQLGQYKILVRIAAGGMGEIYRARDTRLSRDVAIKVLPSSFSNDPDRLRRFEQEARAAAALNHPNILAVFQMGTYEGAPYLVSELLEGGTLREQLERGSMPPRKVIDYGVQIAHGLAAAHEKGIVHRDLKPENLFITKDGRVKILDFGLAKLIEPKWPLDSKAPTVSRATEPGVVMGTVGYMAPEQVSGIAADHRADIFSFGAILYEMLTGKRAFQKPTAVETMSAILNEDPPAVSQLVPTTPPALQRVVQRCLEKTPEQRFQSASDLAFALEALSDSGSAPKPAPGKQNKAIDSLAVLPLDNASGDPEADYLSDGIAETLMNCLSQLRKIRIIPWAVASRHRGPGVNPLKAGQELGVRSVLSGRMVQRGEDLIVSVELVDVNRQARLWGGRYHRKIRDLIAFQEELTTEISDKLRLKLTGEDKRKLRKRPTQNNEAFRLVLQAQHFGEGLSPEGLRKAIALCQQAIEIDPEYAAPYARLSTTYRNLGIHGYALQAEVYPRAIQAAKKALELDETFADAHVSLGYCLIFQNWDFTGAKRELRRSLELNPDLAIGFAFSSIAQQIEARFEEAIANGKRAVELAPADFTPSLVLGTAYLNARRFDKAIEELQRTTEIDPGSARAHDLLAQAHAAVGQRQKAIEECDTALALGRRATFLLLRKALAYAMLGEAGEARGILQEVEKGWTPDGRSSFGIEAVHACLGEKDAAFEWLERAFHERAAWLVFLKVAGFFATLHGDPRFDSLVKRIGIPD